MKLARTQLTCCKFHMYHTQLPTTPASELHWQIMVAACCGAERSWREQRQGSIGHVLCVLHQSPRT